MPTGLLSYMNPEDHLDRCFPFLFIKNECSNIDSAVFSNLHSASQALFNIYMWIIKAGHQTAFFKDVCLFLLAINAQQVIARVHRAVPVAVGDQTTTQYKGDDAKPHTCIEQAEIAYGAR